MQYPEGCPDRTHAHAVADSLRGLGGTADGRRPEHRLMSRGPQPTGGARQEEQIGRRHRHRPDLARRGYCHHRCRRGGVERPLVVCRVKVTHGDGLGERHPTAGRSAGHDTVGWSAGQDTVGWSVGQETVGWSVGQDTAGPCCGHGAPTAGHDPGAVPPSPALTTAPPTATAARTPSDATTHRLLRLVPRTVARPYVRVAGSRECVAVMEVSL
jgi:hypothetical protein